MSGTRYSPPISSHPAFSAAVSAWFAALFGLSLFVIPAAALEGLVSATGISSLITAAAPPIGIAGRLSASLIGAVLGAAIGLVIAKRVAASSRSALDDIEPVETETVIDAFVDDPATIEADQHELVISEETPEESPEATQWDSGEIVQEEPVHEETTPKEPLHDEPARQSIADRLASRVRASESREPSVSEDVAAMAAAAAARESEGMPRDPSHNEFNGEPGKPAAEPAAPAVTELDEAARSADMLLAKMPPIERTDDKHSVPGEPTDDILSASDPYYGNGDEPAVEVAEDVFEQLQPLEGERDEGVADGVEPTQVEPAHNMDEPDGRDGIGDVAEPGAEQGEAKTIKPDLGQMVSRLNQSMTQLEATEPAKDELTATGSQVDVDGETTEEVDPVVAFLRREADRAGSAPRNSTAEQDRDDSQDRLRQALDRLTQVSGRA